jgi:quercetin dioxygenase-like cupin family protein
VARAGDTIENPFTGERITFLKTAGETGGELLRFEYALPPRFSIPGHVHPRQEERHEVLSGTLRGRVGGRERDYGPGERVVGPAGVPHAWRNPSGTQELRIVSELRPALGFEALMEVYFETGRDLKTNRKALPKDLLRVAVLADESKHDFYPTAIPIPVWRVLLAPLGALAYVARRLGYGVER